MKRHSQHLKTKSFLAQSWIGCCVLLSAGFVLFSCAEGEVVEIGTSETETFTSGLPSSGTGAVSTSVAPSSNLETVTIIAEATDWAPSATDYPIGYGGSPLPRHAMLGDGFSALPLAASYQNKNYTAQFDFSYPANNFRLTTAHLIIDTLKDDTDTEAIIIDGYYTGYTVGNEHTSSFVDSDWSCLIPDGGDNSACSSSGNYYYSEHSLTHYSIDDRNTFDLDILEVYSDYSIANADDRAADAYDKLYESLSDGRLELFLGDDSPIFKAYLVITGLTVADDALSCVDTANYTFTNKFVHNDGSSTGQSMITGTTVSSLQSASGLASDSVQFYFDQSFPNVDEANLTVSTATVDVNIKRNGTDPVALIVNGVGIAESAFTQGSATANVESWIEDGGAITAFEALLAGVTSGGFSNVSFDLNTLFTSAEAKNRLLQGKLNIDIAGVTFNGSTTANQGYTMGDVSQGVKGTAWRDFRKNVSGPELTLAGTYYTQDCTVPDDPDSPVTQTGGAAQADDGQPPVISSVQVTEIGSDTVKVIWLTNEPSSSSVFYGEANPTNETSIEGEFSNFHEVVLTGLSPYTLYNFQVRSIDATGASSTTNISEFLTKR